MQLTATNEPYLQEEEISIHVLSSITQLWIIQAVGESQHSKNYNFRILDPMP